MPPLVSVLTPLALVPTGWLFAQVDGGMSYVDDLIKGGPFAVVVLLIIMDRLTTPAERDILRAQNTELRAEVRDLNKELRTVITPLLADVAKTLSEMEPPPPPRRRTS